MAIGGRVARMPGLSTRIRSAVAELPGVYWTLWVGTIVNRLGGFVLPFLAFYLTGERGLSKGVAGVVMSLYGVGSLLAASIGGVLADRIGRRPTLLMGLCGGGAAMLGLGFAHSVTEIGAMAFVVGLLGDLYRPAVMATVADVVPPDKRRLAYGYLYWAINLGFAGGSFIAGFVARLSYFALFVADAATTLVYAGIVWRLVPETRPKAAPASERSGPPQGLVHVLRDPVFMPFIVLCMLMGLIFMQHLVAMPIAMAGNGLTESTYGAVIALNGVLIVLFQPAATRATAGVRRSRALAVSCVLTGIGFGMYAGTTTAWGYALGVFVWTLGEIASAPVSSAIVADLAPAHLRGRYQGVYSMAWSVGSLVGPVGGAFIMEHAGERALWLGCLGLGVVAAVGNLVIAPARRRRLAALRSEGQSRP